MAEFAAMASVAVEGDRLVVRPLGWHKIWAMRGSLSVPLRSVSAVHLRTRESLSSRLGLRMPGTSLPGIYAAGTFVSKQRRQFWVAAKAEYLLVIELDGEEYQRVVLQVADANAVIATVQAARLALGETPAA